MVNQRYASVKIKAAKHPVIPVSAVPIPSGRVQISPEGWSMHLHLWILWILWILWSPLITFALVQVSWVSWSKLATTTTFMVLYPGSRLRIIQQVLDHKANKQRPVPNHQWQTIRLVRFIWLIWHRCCPFDFCLMYISKDPRAAGWLHTGNFALLQGGDRYHCEVATLDDQGWLLDYPNAIQCSELKLWQPKKPKLSPGPLPRHTWLEDSKRMTGRLQRHKNHIEHYRTIQNDAMSCATETISRNVALDTPQWQRRTPQWKDM